MCPAVKKQFMDLYSGLGYKPNKRIYIPGYIPIPPEGGGPTPVPADFEERVRNTTITVTDPDGHQETVTVEQMTEMLVGVIADMEEAKKKYLTGHVVDDDSDSEPDGEIIYLNPEITGR